MARKPLTIALIGNPNCGKTTLFNGLTGSHQHIGNWPGVTVEKKVGDCSLSNGDNVRIVDLPGIYSLTAQSEDEKASLEYILSKDADLYINVIDATTIERNIYLTMLLAEIDAPMIIVLSMMDIAKERGIEIDIKHLEEHLGVPVLGLNANKQDDVHKLLKTIEKYQTNLPHPKIEITYPNEIEAEIDILSSCVVKTSQAFGFPGRWIAIKALEGDPLITKAISDYHDMASEILESSIKRITDVLTESPDIVLAEARYGTISGLSRDVISFKKSKVFLSEIADKFIINRFLGIPIFFLMMYIVFWLTQSLGGAFIDFFEILGNAIFVDGLGHLLNSIGTPAWIVTLLAGGLGAGVRTIATFIPPIFFMFLCLSILEDSGYMARAAFVMDRLMRSIGLPGKSFVPLLVGFGCTVPAIMATKALDSKRDRFLTIFMTPFMSCGAKLPVYTVFGAAFFASNPGSLVFFLYLSGVILGIISGLILKRTLFKGEPSHFIMELPPYHIPRPKHILLHTWDRLKLFIFRAGKVIVPMVLILGILNSVGRDGTFGNEGTQKSLLSFVGEKLTPVFVPMGVERDNWPAAVSLISGLFAKESVVGTLTSLYGQETAKESVSPVHDTTNEKPTFSDSVKEAFASIPTNLKKLFIANEEDEEEIGDAIYKKMRNHFSKGPHQAFAYLLFVLLYVPCVAATGLAVKELGPLFGTIFVCYLTILGWSTATLYYQITVGHSLIFTIIPIVILTAIFSLFNILGRKRNAA